MKFVCCILAVHSVWSLAVAQTTASLRGQVTDETAAVIPGAKVVLIGPSGRTRTTAANAEGLYSFSGLPAGDYTVQASAPDLVSRPI